MNFAVIGQNIVKLWLKYWDKFLITGMEYTLSLAALTVFFGAIIGSLIALMRMSKIPPLRWIAAVYTELIRGTPMLLQLYDEDELAEDMDAWRKLQPLLRHAA